MGKSKKKNRPEAPNSTAEWRQGTLVKSTGSFYEVELESGERVTCTLRGKFRISDIRSTNPVAVGDHLRITLGEPTSLIQELLPRKNYVLRRAINLSKRVHILCANIDQAFILFTLDHPVTTLGYVDRLLVTCEAYHIAACILFNKADILDTPDLKARLEDYRTIYEAAGYQTLTLSAQDPQYRPIVQEMMRDKVSFVVGRSGAGKSTFVNLADPSLSLKTGIVSDFSGRGKHTTTHAEMFPLTFGGHIIDSPGFKEMEIFDIEEAELGGYFPEMRPFSDDCKFSNCIHEREPGCAVKAAVEAGKIAESRYHTYLGMLAEIREQ